MIFAEDIRRTILKLANERGPEKSFGPSEVAQLVDQEVSQDLMDQVWFVASVLIKEGKIAATPPIDSGEIKSETTLRLRKAK